jgi:D-serine deaminase-like pyridoxal phosphate-dependent protein
MTVGGRLSELDTPALLVDLDVLESNIARMMGVFKSHGVGWRPHTKAVKIPAVAHKLLAAGAHGVTVSKLSEADVMAAAGISDILITGPLATRFKAVRLACLRKSADPIATVDCLEHIELLDCAACDYGVELRIVVEVDIGLNRAGAQPGAPAVELASAIHRRKGLRFAGLMAWEGQTARILDASAKSDAVRGALSGLMDTARMCRAAGLPVEIISCGGTGTYTHSASIPGPTEIVAGGGIWGDLLYRNQYGVDHPMAMSVLSTVISRPNPTRIITDSGFKSLSAYLQSPQPMDLANVASVRMSAEHGTVELSEPNTDVKVGDQLCWHVGYTDATVILHETLYGIRHGIVETAWPISGRGKLQ